MGAPTLRAAAAAVLLLLAACSQAGGADDRPTRAPASETTSRGSPGPASEPSAAPVATRRLDSIAVIGHSGATGTLSDPNDPRRDATENSWATGDNPEVRSVYLRLLETHPALEGHHYNQAVNGTGVGDLDDQVDALMGEVQVVPDLVLVQSIDNDMRCDGTDRANYRPFARTLDRVLAHIARVMPDARVFFVSQWASVRVWTEWAKDVSAHVTANSGTGPCDVFDATGRPRPAGIRSMQAITDAYWRQVERVCARHQGCSTDGLAQSREFVPEDADLAFDWNHLSIRGHAKYAAIAWRSLPDSIKRAR
jgi:hypothetical protein